MGVRLAKVCVSFGPVRVIEDLDLEVAGGEMVALLGPSGCGKTTTLLAISGIHRPSSGRVCFGERDVTELPPQERNVGVVFQSYALYPHLSAYENIAFPLRVRKEGSADVARKTREIASIMHIETLLDRRPAQLSGGQQQRVAVARALVRDPDVLLMDEPLANLDAGLRLEMRSELRRIQQSIGCTTLLVTHDQGEAMSMCDRIAVLNRGRIEQIGTPAEIYVRPRNLFVAGFIGSPPISLYAGRMIGRGFEGQALRFALPPRLRAAATGNGAPFTVGVRPEGLQPRFEIPVEGTIAFVEPQGRETLYGLALADERILRSVQPGPPKFDHGQRVRWGLDPDRLLFFDERGDRVWPPETTPSR